MENNPEIKVENHRFIRFEDSLIGYNKEGKLVCKLGKNCTGYRQYAFMGFTINSFLLNLLSEDAIIYCKFGHQTVKNIKKLGCKCMGTPHHCDWYVNCSIFNKTIDD